MTNCVKFYLYCSVYFLVCLHFLWFASLLWFSLEVYRKGIDRLSAAKNRPLMLYSLIRGVVTPKTPLGDYR